MTKKSGPTRGKRLPEMPNFKAILLSSVICLSILTGSVGCCPATRPKVARPELMELETPQVRNCRNEGGVDWCEVEIRKMMRNIEKLENEVDDLSGAPCFE